MLTAVELLGLARPNLRGTSRVIVADDGATLEVDAGREKTLQKRRKSKKAWYAANRDAIAKYRREWRQNNPELIGAQRKRDRKNREAAIKAYMADWHRKRRAKLRFVAGLFAVLSLGGWA